jgi:hypothetical protein
MLNLLLTVNLDHIHDGIAWLISLLNVVLAGIAAAKVAKK